jgi:hypothetical protein
MACDKRKLLKSTIADFVKQRGDLTREQQGIRAKELLNMLDAGAEDIFSLDPVKQIPAIIEYTYEWQLDTTTSQELIDQAAQLRELAETAKAYLGGGDPEAALAAGLALGMALEQFLYQSGPIPISEGKHRGVKRNLDRGRSRRHPEIPEATKAAISKFIEGLIRNNISKSDVIQRAMRTWPLVTKTALDRKFYRPAKRAMG